MIMVSKTLDVCDVCVTRGLQRPRTPLADRDTAQGALTIHGLYVYCTLSAY